MKDIYNIQIERSILATILFDPQIIGEVEEELDSSDFGYENHKKIFNIMIDLYRNDLPVNGDFIQKKAENKNANFDSDFFEIISTSAIVGIKEYINEIKDLSLKRKLHTLANNIKNQSIELNMSSIDIINNIESEVFKLQSNSNNTEFRELKDIVSSTLQIIQEKKEQDNSILLGIDTGFPRLNQLTNGFKSGELIVLAARPGMGKTALAINILQPTLKQNKAVAFFSLEMDAEQIFTRMISSITSIPGQRLIVGDLDNSEWQYLSNMCEKISSWKLYIDDNGNLNISKLKSKIRKLKLKDPSLSLVVIDYLQIMSGIGKQERHLEIAEISRSLKNLAREVKIPILALSQLNRELEKRRDRRPMLSDLRESGAIEQDADIILFLYRDSVYRLRDEREKIAQAKDEGKAIPKETTLDNENDEVELIIGKHRNGALDTIKLTMHPQYSRFVAQNTYDENTQKETEIIDMPI